MLEHYDANDDVANRNLMLQEFVPGGNDQTYTFNGYFNRSGRCAVAFTGRKLRNFPGEFGQGSLGECRKVEEVETTTIRFMEEIGYRGCLDLGYRYDARDGRFKVIDINPRGRRRMLPSVRRCEWHGRRASDVPGPDRPAGRAVRHPGGASLDGRGRRSTLGVRRFRRGDLTLREWLLSLRGVQELSYVSVSDPRPALPILRAHLRGARRAPRARRTRAFGQLIRDGSVDRGPRQPPRVPDALGAGASIVGSVGRGAAGRTSELSSVKGH